MVGSVRFYVLSFCLFFRLSSLLASFLGLGLWIPQLGEQAHAFFCFDGKEKQLGQVGRLETSNGEARVSCRQCKSRQKVRGI